MPRLLETFPLPVRKSPLNADPFPSEVGSTVYIWMVLHNTSLEVAYFPLTRAISRVRSCCLDIPHSVEASLFGFRESDFPVRLASALPNRISLSFPFLLPFGTCLLKEYASQAEGYPSVTILPEPNNASSSLVPPIIMFAISSFLDSHKDLSPSLLPLMTPFLRRSFLGL